MEQVNSFKQEVCAIIAHDHIALDYQVLWVDGTMTWEPQSIIQADVPSLVEEYRNDPTLLSQQFESIESLEDDDSSYHPDE